MGAMSEREAAEEIAAAYAEFFSILLRPVSLRWSR